MSLNNETNVKRKILSNHLQPNGHSSIGFHPLLLSITNLNTQSQSQNTNVSSLSSEQQPHQQQQEC